MPVSKYTKSSGGVWTRTDNYSFNYSDGDEIENRLLRQVQQAKDVSLASDELQRFMVDWPSEYHFSPLRANLLSPFHLHQFDNILEIGSGCGAMTRVLGEQCPASKIIALEGSMRRAEITKARCRDLKNVEIFQDSFADFEQNDPFDLISMIGVLEYSPSYFKGENPILEALNRTRRLLCANGVLIVAIENQLGLKYFNGCEEDHNGQPFFGINDLYRLGTFRTFGKKQLEEQFAQAGFDRVEFVYPFPDYKLPQLLLREESFQCDELDLSHLAGQYPSRDYSRVGDKIFQETRVWNLLSQNDLLRDLANSFLVFAFCGDRSLADLTDPWLLKSFSCKRKKRYLIETVFQKEQDRLVVEKKLCYPSAFDQPKNIIHHVGKVDYIKGVPYGYSLLDQVSKKDSLAQFIHYLTPWVNWLRENAYSQSSSTGDETLLLPGELYDCMPTNFLVNKHKQLCLIDQEWEYRKPLELGFVLFRGLYRELTTNLIFFEQTDLFANGNLWDVLAKIYDAFGLFFDQDIFVHYLDIEITFQLEVCTYNVGRKELIDYLHNFFEERRTQKSGITELLLSGGTRRHALLIEQEKMLRQVVVERDEQIAALNLLVGERDQELLNISKSHSWRLTAPLRSAGHLVRDCFKKIYLS
ncbi:MAG: methyltransferase [Candidatus Electrothrix sp. AR4]|nr:methyltransferase [Candidatus Electrothrix sp. AR4]